MVETRTIGGRYEVVRPLKRGGEIETLLARDLEGGGDVVVKTAPAASLSPCARRRLEHEAEVLRGLRGPFLAPLAAFGEDGDRIFLVVPFVPGEPLDARLRGARPLPARAALAVGRSVLAALAAAHANGVLHRDVKPANVIVAPDGQGSAPAPASATLVDFGLARSARLDASIREAPVGTARYVAPEQAGLIPGGVDERSDLYSAGATVYECLTGRPAFAGESLGEVLRAHLGPRPRDSRALGLATPRALDEVVARLLRLDPRERYQSAEAALADLDLIAAALERGIADPEIAIGARDRRAALAEPAFIGRGDEVAALDAELARAARGRGGLVLVEAPSGGGKTRLLDEVARRATRAGAWVLRGEGAEEAAPRPFQLLDGVVREAAAAARAEPATAGRLSERLGPHLDAAVAALPELAAVVGTGPGAGAALGTEAHGEVRTLRALAALLDALGSAERPAVVLLDDAQWADELTPRLLGEWRPPRGAGEAKGHVALVVSFRTEEVGADHALRRLESARRLVLPPFAPAETRKLLESMAGPLPDEAVEAVARASEGNPFLAGAVLHGLAEAGALARGADGWRLDARALADIPVSRRAAVLIAHRLERLPAGAARLLPVGALLGREFDVDLAAALSGEDAREAAAAVLDARRRGLVFADGARARCTFAHDRLREALLARLDDGERRRLHRLAALRIEALDRERVFELAHHFDGAGEGGRALPYALAAALQARARHAAEVAERYYRIADRGAGAADPATRLRAVLGLADVLALRGRFDEGAAACERARALAGADLVARAEIEGRLGDLERKRGRVQDAIRAHERALRLLGQPVPRTRLGLALALLREVADQVLHTWFPRRFVSRRAPAGAERDLLAVRFYDRLSLAYFFAGGHLRMLWAHLRELNVAERYGPTPELGRAHGEHGWALAVAFPNWERCRVYAARGAATCEALGDLWGRGHALTCSAFALLVVGRFREAIEHAAEAERVMEKVGDPWEIESARYFRAWSLYRLGDLRAAAELCRSTHEAARAFDSQLPVVATLQLWATVTEGRVPAAHLDRELARPRDNPVAVHHVLQAKGACCLAAGETDEAVAVLEEADRVVRRAGLRHDTLPLLPLKLSSALRAAAAKRSPLDARGREALLARAARSARRGLGQARTFRTNLPAALREVALVDADRGAAPRRVRRLLDESLALAESQGQRYERARTLAARGEIGRALGWPDAAADEEAGRRGLAACGALDLEPGGGEARDGAPAVTLSLADRFGTVLETGRTIATALAREAVLAAAREAALDLLRGERCEVVAIGPDGPEPRDGVSRTALERALAAGRPVVLAEGLSGDPADSVVLAGVRSALCAPIVAHGRPAAALYVTHRQVGGLFGDEELRLAEFIAALAGAALENAAGIAANRRADEEIRRLSEAIGRGQEDERRRLALALHDGAGQLVAALALRLEGIAPARADEPGAAGVAGARALVDRLGEEVRRIAQDLRPAALDRLGLADALVDLARSFSSAALEVEARVADGDGRESPAMAAPRSLPPETAGALFRIAQEALVNVARHAGARRASVVLERGPGRVRLTVEDDGQGFDPRTPPAGRGIGLVGMRERAAWLGGTFELESAPGRGTRVRVAVPVDLRTPDPENPGVAPAPGPRRESRPTEARP